MIQLTHFKGNTFYLNAELIKTVEATPDTVITLLDESKIVVRERPEEIAERFIHYRRAVLTSTYPPRQTGA